MVCLQTRAAVHHSAKRSEHYCVTKIYAACGRIITCFVLRHGSNEDRFLIRFVTRRGTRPTFSIHGYEYTQPRLPKGCRDILNVQETMLTTTHIDEVNCVNCLESGEHTFRTLSHTEL
jgi:hypothetical protein